MMRQVIVKEEKRARMGQRGGLKENSRNEMKRGKN